MWRAGVPTGHQNSTSSCLKMLSTEPVLIPAPSRTRLSGVCKDLKGLQRVWPLEESHGGQVGVGGLRGDLLPHPRIRGWRTIGGAHGAEILRPQVRAGRSSCVAVGLVSGHLLGLSLPTELSDPGAISSGTISSVCTVLSLWNFP